MALGLDKRAIGVFSNRQDTEAALNALKTSDFRMNKISVVARDVTQDDEMVSSQTGFIRKQTIKGLRSGVLAGGALLGGIGGLVAGLGMLTIPGLDSVNLAGAQAVLAGVFAGGFYGSAAGGIIGAVIGNGVSREQAKAYSDRLSNGEYVVIVDGTDEEIRRAESVLSAQGIQDWGVSTSTT
jgi:hypothetical protein